MQDCIWLIISETQVYWFQQGHFLHSKKPIGGLSIGIHGHSNHKLQSSDYFCLPEALLQQGPLIFMVRRWLPCLHCLCIEMKAKEKRHLPVEAISLNRKIYLLALL